MKTVVVVQARTLSSRMPGKVLRSLAGAPMLARQIERMRAAATPFDLVVATTTESCDDAVEDVGRAAGVRVFRGHATDLLDRHWRAALDAGADVVVKVPSDCPLIDPAVIDRVLGAFDSARHDYASNLHPATYPDGNDVEVMTMSALETAWREADLPYEREHTTPFLWDRPERFRLANVAWELGLDYSMSHRFTVDYPEDHAFVSAVYDALYSPPRVFGVGEILAFLEARPDIFAINRRYAGVNWYRHHLGELKTVRPSETKQVVEER
jgi:spore coat polysaccharide biosynthesis protein SpsF